MLPVCPNLAAIGNTKGGIYLFREKKKKKKKKLMLDVSWGEMGLVVAVGLALVGKRDLPRVAHIVGTQVGRLVGFVQGARARADRLSAHSELRQLQHELRLGLRELDAVKSELAVSLSGPGLMNPSAALMRGMVGGGGGGLGTGTGMSRLSSQPMMIPPAPTLASSSYHGDGGPTGPQPMSSNGSVLPTLPPVAQTVAAVAEEEWIKRGMAFQSRAERGEGMRSSTSYDPTQSGSVLLEQLLRQSLVFDQYDRTVREQDQALQSRVNRIMVEQQQEHQQQRRGNAQQQSPNTREHSPGPIDVSPPSSSTITTHAEEEGKPKVE